MSEQIKILIVEDDSIISREIKFQLESLNYNVVGIERKGKSAIQKTGELKPDLILMDINLSGDIDGIEAASIIKNNFMLPVVFLTCMSDDTEIHRARESEPYGYIIKSANMEMLNASIIIALNRCELENKIRLKEEQSNAILNSLNASICVIDKNGLIIKTNNQWRKFGADNSGFNVRTGEGMNYLQICDDTRGDDVMSALEFASGIREVLDGKCGQFSMEYACHSSNVERWFDGIVTPFPDQLNGTIGAVISHVDITKRMEIENDLEQHRNHLEKLVRLRTIDIKNAEEEINRLNMNILNLQEEERQRVSRDLHDGVGQTILAAKINLDTYKNNPDRFAGQLNTGIEFLVKASQELREIYMGLYPTILTDLGLEMTIRWLVENTMKSAGIKSNLEINLINKLPHDLEVNTYRIIQELFSNILKHSHADTMDLSLSSEDRIMKLIVKDNGIGIKIKENDKIVSGCGMGNVKIRVSHLNGKVKIGINKPHGMIISITIKF